MKKSFLLIVSLCMVILQLYAQRTPSRIEKKNFSDINEIRFDHSYGNITVTESDSKQVDLEIQYFDEDEVKPFSEISTINKVLAIRTVIPSRNNWSYGTSAGIDYIIAVPKNVAMKINLKYGNISMGDYYGDFKCNFSYGNLNANTFFKSPVDISCKYSNVKIDKVDVLDLSIAYGNVSINSIQRFRVDSKYSKYDIDKVDILEATCSYGGVDIGSIIEFDGSLRYTPMTIYDIDKKLNLKCAYSTIKIKNSSKNLKSIKFDGSYSNLELGIDPNLSANLDVYLKYGNLSVDNKFNVKYSFSEKDYKTTTKKGVIGNKTPTANISISDSYANVKIYTSKSKLSMNRPDSIINQWKENNNIGKITYQSESYTHSIFDLGDNKILLDEFVQSLKSEIQSPVAHKIKNGKTFYELYSMYDNVNHKTHTYSYDMEDRMNIKVTHTIEYCKIADSNIANIQREIDNGMRELEIGMSELDKGARELDKGMNELDRGMSELNRGMSELDKGMRELDNAKRELDNAKRELDSNHKIGKVKFRIPVNGTFIYNGKRLTAKEGREMGLDVTEF